MPTCVRQQLLLVCVLCAMAVGPSAQSPAPRFPVAVGLESSANPSVSGVEVTFTARIAVLGPPTETPPTGAVEFYDGATLLGTVELTAADGKASASLSTPSLLEGPHPITARYAGDAGFIAGSSEPVTQLVTAQGN